MTHSPRRLSETLALVRPFTGEVWIALLITVILSGPALYLIVIMPSRIKRKIVKKRLAKPKSFHHIMYIREITGNARLKRSNPIRNRLLFQTNETANILDQCIWFTVNVYLKQCKLAFDKDFIWNFYWILCLCLVSAIYTFHA